jgi:hypothetical protein
VGHCMQQRGEPVGGERGAFGHIQMRVQCGPGRTAWQMIGFCELSGSRY